MSEEDILIQQELVEEIMKASEQFPNVILYMETVMESYEELEKENQQSKEVIEEVREYLNSYDVFKEFSFPLMKREEENQTKSSIKYEFDTSIKKELLEILDKVGDNNER